MPQRYTPDELRAQAEATSLKSDKKLNEWKRQEMLKVLKEHPENVDRVLERIRELQAHTGSGGGCGGSGSSTIVKPAVPKQQIGHTQPNCYTGTPSQLFVRCITRVNKVVFSEGNIKATMRPGQREPDRIYLAEWFEYSTDRPCNQRIPTGERNLDFQMQACEAAAVQERLCNVLITQVDIQDKDGIYEYIDLRSSRECSILIKRRHKQEKGRRCPITLTGEMDFVSNYSSADVWLRETQDGGKSFKCVLLFGIPDTNVAVATEPPVSPAPPSGADTSANISTGCTTEPEAFGEKPDVKLSVCASTLYRYIWFTGPFCLFASEKVSLAYHSYHQF